MPRQWKTGTPPKGLREDRVLVLGPDEMWDSDFRFVCGVMDDFTAPLEHFRVVLHGTGHRYTTTRSGKRFYGADYLARRWAERDMVTQMYCHGYDSFRAAVKDILASIGEDPYLLYFKDDLDADTPAFFTAVRPHVRSKRVKVVRV